jgi:opacity protein-like surface antigen
VDTHIEQKNSKMKHIALATAIAALAAPAFAGNITPPVIETVVTAPPPAPVAQTYDWTGGYVGVQLGYGKLDVSGGTADDREGAIGGLHAGYDYDFGSYVLGASAAYNMADTDVNGANLSNVKARAGYKMGMGLLYATGGIGFASAEIGGVDRSDTGWVAGVGYDHMVTQNISVGGEVLYQQVTDFDGSGLDISGTTVQAKLAYRF